MIDPAYQSGAGGMEYPTLFTAGTRRLSPRQTNSPEAVTVHEAGHQFWYGMVGNNEFDHAWMDEGFNTFSEERVQSIAFQPNYRVERFFGGFLPWQQRDIPLKRETDGNGLNFYRPRRQRRFAGDADVALLARRARADHLLQDGAVAEHARAAARMGDAAADPARRTSIAGSSVTPGRRISSRSPTR